MKRLVALLVLVALGDAQAPFSAAVPVRVTEDARSLAVENGEISRTFVKEGKDAGAIGSLAHRGQELLGVRPVITIARVGEQTGAPICGWSSMCAKDRRITRRSSTKA